MTSIQDASTTEGQVFWPRRPIPSQLLIATTYCVFMHRMRRNHEAEPCTGLASCQQCGMVSADLAVSDAELTRLYGRDYFHGQEYFDYVAEEQSLKLNFQLRIATLQQLDPQSGDFRIIRDRLRVWLFPRSGAWRGTECSWGRHLGGCGGRSPWPSVGSTPAKATYLTMDLGRQVDIVTLWDTIEHLKRPDLFVEKIACDVRHGGHIALTTSDIDSLNARLRGWHWRMIHPPTHLHYFSVRSISRLLDKSGFDLVHVSHPGQSRTLGEMAYLVLARQMNKPALYTLFERLPMARWGLTLNLFDIMFVVARRR